MKRIRKLILFTTISIILIFLYSCSDNFLVNEPPGTASESVMETPNGVESLLVGAYDRLNGSSENNPFGHAMATDWTYGSGASDDVYKGSTFGDQSAFNQVEQYNTNPTSPYLDHRWRESYDGVARANEVLTYLSNTQETDNPISEDRATEIEGEAKFLRAWFHFKANLIFENIPYVKTEEELGDLAPEEIPNSSPGWEGIEADLQLAIDNLPPESPQGEVGRADRYAAMAVKAKAHLYQNEFQEAKPLLDNIINSGEFELVDNYNDNFRQDTENNAESIFEIQATAEAGVANNIMMAGPAAHQTGGPAGVGWGFYQPSQNLFEAFQTTPEGLPVLDVESRDELANDMGVSSDEEFIPTDHNLDLRVDYTIARRGVDYMGFGIHPGAAWIRSQNNG
ncbi:MAG TPA: RagB/SusD family nutrient uptake outer membrane protein, partial [Fodinibius sp.]|nr:RagB/SusD family nutrient uptake outer membrane protein [Fodinibius sp.]